MGPQAANDLMGMMHLSSRFHAISVNPILHKTHWDGSAKLVVGVRMYFTKGALGKDSPNASGTGTT